MCSHRSACPLRTIFSLRAFFSATTSRSMSLAFSVDASSMCFSTEMTSCTVTIFPMTISPACLAADATPRSHFASTSASANCWSVSNSVLMLPIRSITTALNSSRLLSVISPRASIRSMGRASWTLVTVLSGVSGTYAATSFSSCSHPATI